MNLFGFSSLGTATRTQYGYVFVWNTTAVPNGTYTLQSVVTDAAGNYVYSPGISVTVANPTPTTAVLIPSGGASVSGTSSLLDASASANVTYVAFELSGGTINGEQFIATATQTYYGWLALWNTTSVPNGTYQLRSVASYSQYFSGGTSAPVTIHGDQLVRRSAKRASFVSFRVCGALISGGPGRTSLRLSDDSVG